MGKMIDEKRSKAVEMAETLNKVFSDFDLNVSMLLRVVAPLEVTKELLEDSAEKDIMDMLIDAERAVAAVTAARNKVVELRAHLTAAAMAMRPGK